MLLLAAWLHTLNPFVVRFTDTVGVRWYGLSYLAGFLVAYVLLLWLIRRGACLIPAHRAADAMLWLIGGVLVGGRLGYCLVYQPSLFTTTFDHFPFWGVLALNEGGMASHGGIVGVILAGWRVSRGFKSLDPAKPGVIEGRCPWQHVCDILALLCPVGMFFGRIANFINGELLGAIVAKPGTPGPWWTVQFPQELLLKNQKPPLTPEQNIALEDLIQTAAARGDSPARALERLVANAAQYADQLRPLLSARHPSQIYQAIAEGLIVGVIVWAAAAKPRKPGVVGSIWLIAYGAMRIITEIWRLPDDKYGDAGRIYGLSRGQWLSVAMVAAGTGTLVWCTRRTAEKVGGWMRARSASAGPRA